MARVRLGHRHTRPHGAGGEARQDPRTARAHAQPETGNGHLRRGAGRARGQGRAGGVPRGQGGQRARTRGQALVPPGALGGERARLAGGARPGQAGRLEGNVPPLGDPVVHHGAGHQGGPPAPRRAVQEVSQRSADVPNAEKVESIQSLKERFEGVKTAVLTEYRGLTVRQLSDLRKHLKGAGAEYKVVENRLGRLAGKGSLQAFVKANPALTIKVGLVEGKVIEPQALRTLAELPSKQALRSQLVGAIQG